MNRATATHKRAARFLGLLTAGTIGLALVGSEQTASAQPPPAAPTAQPAPSGSTEPAPAPTTPPPSGDPAPPASETQAPPPATPPATPPQEPGAVTVTEAEAKDVLTALKTGQPLTPLAQAKGTDVASLGKAVMTMVKQQLPAAVQAGQYTQEQADKIVAQLQSRVDDAVKREGAGAAAAGPATETKPGEPAPAAKPAEAAASPGPVRSVTVPVIVTSVIAGAALATGVIFAIDATSKHSAYTKEPDHALGVAGERSAFIADVSFGMAALFGLTSLALYLIPDDEPAAKKSATTLPKAPSRKWTAGPTAMPKGGGFSAAFQF